MTKTSENALRVGLDGKRAVLNNTGLGNYSRYCVNIMSMAFPSAQFILYSPKFAENERLEPLLSRGNVELVVPALKPDWGLSRAWWRSVDMPLRLSADKIDVYHGLSNELPLTIKKVCPAVVTIHDLIYRRFPQGYSAIDRRLYDFKYGRSARIADRIIAISECTKSDIVKDYDIDPRKIDVIYQGVDPIFTLKVDTARRQEVRARYSLPEKYILAVGTVEERKNLLLAIEALPKLPAAVKLIVVGGMKGQYGERVRRAIERLGLADRVMHLQVPFKDLPPLYADAEFTSYTSRYEGFGLPVAESLTMGTPVIACTGSCLEEAGGEGAVYVQPDDVDAYAEAAIRLIDDKVFREIKARKGMAHVRRFTADAFAKDTMACYRKAIIDSLS